MSHSVECKLYDLTNGLLADISPIALEKTLTRKHNQSTSFTITAPAGHSLLTSAAGDGYPNLRRGNRKLLVWEDGQIIFHGRIFSVERTGDGTKNEVTIVANDPLLELGYDSDDRAGRPVRDATGNFITPKFVTGTGGVVSGPDLISQILVNSQNADPLLGEGPLPINLGGSFDLTVPPAIDLSCVDSMSWPVLIGDFIAQLVQTNVVDLRLRPIDPAEGLDPYEMVQLSAVSSLGTDRSGIVHFDYWTGSKNAAAVRHLEDFHTINNKLYDYLGPRSTTDLEHWRGNIAPDSPGVTVDPSGSRALYGGPDGGQFASIRVFDSIGTENSSRPLYLALYNAELGLRVEPRDILYITPSPDAKALFEPPADYDCGDLVGINVGDALGISLAEKQRVYGYTRTWDRQGVARVSELLTSADA